VAEDIQGTRTFAQRMVQSARSVVWQTILHPSADQKETRPSKTGKQLHLVETEDDTEDKFFIDMVTHKVRSLTTKDDDEVASQSFVTMMVNNNANVKFQLNCGATSNLLPLKDFAGVMGDPDDLYIEKSNAKLTMYNGAVMYTMGYILANSSAHRMILPTSLYSKSLIGM